MKQTKKTRKTLLALLTIVSAFILASTALAQGRQAVVLMRSGNTTASSCDGASEMNYQIVYDLKLNSKDEIRLLNQSGSSAHNTSGVSRKDYEDAPKNKLANLYQLKWQNNFFYAVTGVNQTPVLVLPEEMKPQKNASVPVNSFYSVMLSGEARDGKQKRKISSSLRDVWKIYFIPEGGSVNDILFSHAAEERSVVVWESFLQRTSNYRAPEANANMRDVMVGCARVSLEQFKTGNYKALGVARQRTERAQSVKSDVETDKLLVEINQQQQRVNTAREQVVQLINENRVDDAITAAEPIKLYLSTWDDLNSMYNGALKQSHDEHYFKGDKALKGNQLDVALRECTVAWQRLTDSPKARECVCLSRNRVALRDSNNFRQRKQPKLAKELLEKQLADGDCTRDEAILKEFNLAKCEYSQQLFAEARLSTGGGSSPVRPVAARRNAKPSTAVIGGLKVVSAQNKQDFRSAREKLLLAEEMCPEEGARALLNKVNQSLAGYCLTEGRKALQRSDSGTAYVYLMSAQYYTPENSEVNSLLNQARTQFEEKTRVSIGVVFENKASYGNSESVLNEVSSEIESIATKVGLAQPVILDKRQASAAWRALQGGTNLPSPTAIFSGDLLGANVSINGSDRSVRSYYTEENPEWKRRDVDHDAADQQYKTCRKQSGEAACTGLRSRVEELKRYRDSVEHYPKHYYNYSERLIKVSGNARLTFRYTDSISRSVRSAETLTASVTDECLARAGVDSRDRTAGNNDCSQVQESVYTERLSSQLRTDASRRAYGLLADLPLSYYKRAKTAANRQQSVEDYLRFLFLTSAKTGTEAEDAKKALLAFDPELKTDGVLR